MLIGFQWFSPLFFCDNKKDDFLFNREKFIQ